MIMRQNRNTAYIFSALILLTLSSATNAATLVARFDYVGEFYTSFLDDSTPSGAYGVSQQMRGVFYLRLEDIDAGRTYFRTTEIGGNALAADIYGLRLFDARNDLSGLDNILVNGSFVRLTPEGEVDSWDLDLQTPTDISYLAQDQTFERMQTYGPAGSTIGLDQSDIVQCISNCAVGGLPSFDGVYGADRGLVIYPASAGLTASALEVTGQWVRDPQIYEITDAGQIIAVVPVPAAIWLFGSALAGLGWVRRKRTS